MAEGGGADVYSSFNVLLGASRGEQLQSDLGLPARPDDDALVVPEWLLDVLLGYKDPAAAALSLPRKAGDRVRLLRHVPRRSHVRDLPPRRVKVADGADAAAPPPYRLTILTDRRPSTRW